jgi:cytochrome c peroxidase
VRSLISGQARFDQAFAVGSPPNFGGTLSALEQEGRQLFNGAAGCAACHSTHAFVGDAPHNTGLDATITDAGAGNGRFKTPSLRNVAVRPLFMHDGRFQTLAQVVDFYDHGVQPNPGLDGRLRVNGGQPKRLNLTPQQRDALVAFLGTLTDQAFLADPRFSDPFRK